MSATASLASSESRPKATTPFFSLRNAAVAAALPLTIFCAGKAEAISTIEQNPSNATTTFNNLGSAGAATRSPSPTAFANQNFFQFDSSLGQLVSVGFTATGKTIGSIRGARNSGNPAQSLTSGIATLNANFGTGAWVVNSGAATNIFGFSPLQQTNSSTTSGTLITALTGNSFSLSQTTADPAILAAFTGTGDINAVFNWAITLNLANTSSTKTTNFTFAGVTGTGVTSFSALVEDITLTYTYEPIVVPGPLPLLGSGVAFAYTRRLRRRIQKAGSAA
jgi:hypothetical protein